MNRLAIAACLAIPMLVGPAPVAAQTVIGAAETIETSVTGDAERSIQQGSSIHANERIRTNRSGLGHFEFLDGTKLVIGPDSNLLLDELVYNPNTSSFRKVVLKASSGATRFISGKSNSSAFKIITPIGALGLRGTAFDFRHWRGRTYLMVLDGVVEICNRRNDCRTLRRKCDFVVVDRDGEISDPIQPSRGIFSAFDMAKYFPFVSNQGRLDPGYRLRINTCAGGNNGNNSVGGEGGDTGFDSSGSNGGTGSGT
jgi:hypothetical protein